MSKKNIVVLGLPADRQAVYEEALPRGRVEFAHSQDRALASAKTADVIVVNVDTCGDFLEALGKRDYGGVIIPVTNSRASLNKAISLPGGKSTCSYSFREAPGVVLNNLKQKHV